MHFCFQSQVSDPSSLLPHAFPGQGPALRRLPLSLASLHTPSQDREDDSPRISAEALRKLQDIVEAQKSFLKYQEMRSVLLSGAGPSAARSESKNSDSDKENSVTVTTSKSGRLRKVAKLRKDANVEDAGETENAAKKRKSPSDVVAQELPALPPKSPR